MTNSALIAEDEPLLAQALAKQLTNLWPELQIVKTVGNGQAALDAALALQPDVVFLDIQMPVMTGLEAAQALVEEWSVEKPLPLIVFVTAYDQYAVEAFEHSAMDYVLKPVREERLAQTITKLQARLDKRSKQGMPASQDWSGLQGMLTEMQRQTVRVQDKLQTIQASRHSREGSVIEMVSLNEVVYFEAADKYVRVLTKDHEYLIRTPIKDLLPRIDSQAFWQVHRATVVRVSDIAQVLRDEAGKVWIKLKSRPERLGVSRLYAHLFKAM